MCGLSCGQREPFVARSPTRRVLHGASPSVGDDSNCCGRHLIALQA